MKEGERMVIYPADEPVRVLPCGCTAIVYDDHEVLFPCVQNMAADLLAGRRGVAA